MNFIAYLYTIFLYILAGLAEIGGGWLMWQWLRNGKNIWWGISGGAILIIYGIIPTLQKEPAFGRVYAAYGGIFIVLSLLWGYYVDGWQPDKYDILGATIALIGVTIIIWGRRLGW
ncbi:MAG TPA: YnfA family protein [Anaerolineae bacterium]|nr:YnfA family protein [Anaerolineae bacterium]